MSNAANTETEKTSTDALCVWVALRCMGAASVDRLEKNTGLPRLRIWAALKELNAFEAAGLYQMPEAEYFGSEAAE